MTKASRSGSCFLFFSQTILVDILYIYLFVSCFFFYLLPRFNIVSLSLSLSFFFARTLSRSSYTYNYTDVSHMIYTYIYKHL